MTASDRVVAVAAGFDRKESLLAHMADLLGFPEHFGRNWDAFADCLCDLTWLPAGDVRILHEDLPLQEDPVDAESYVDVLLDAVEHWEEHGGRRFAVEFPNSLRDVVAGFAQRRQSSG